MGVGTTGAHGASSQDGAGDVNKPPAHAEQAPRALAAGRDTRRRSVCDMCWSLESSALSAVVGVVVAAYTYRRGGPWDVERAAMLLSVSLIQVVDALFWLDDALNGLDTCSALNQALTRYILPAVLVSEYLHTALFVELDARWKWVAMLGADVALGSYTFYRGTEYNCTGLKHNSRLWWGRYDFQLWEVVCFVLLCCRNDRQRVPWSRPRNMLNWMVAGTLGWFVLDPFGTLWCVFGVYALSIKSLAFPVTDTTGYTPLPRLGLCRGRRKE